MTSRSGRTVWSIRTLPVIHRNCCCLQFIQNDPKKPIATFFYTVPQVAQGFLSSVRYYLGQQLSKFCISPEYREQSILRRVRTSRSGGKSQQQLHQAASPAPTFLPYCLPGAPPNPPNYVPSFYLINKTPGEGKRDTGIACLEVKIVDWDARVVEKLEEGQLDHNSHSLLYPGMHGPHTTDRLHRIARLHELTKCIQVESLPCANPISGTCALFEFHVWQNGSVGMDELQSRLKTCVQQAISDLITEFGLLSSSIFEASITPTLQRLPEPSVGWPSNRTIVQPREPHSPPSLTAAATGAAPVISVANPLFAPLKDALHGAFRPIHPYHPPLEHPQRGPRLNLSFPMPAENKALISKRPLGAKFSTPPPSSAAASLPPPQIGSVQAHQGTATITQRAGDTMSLALTDQALRTDFISVADEWFSFVSSEAKPYQMELGGNSVKKFTFVLDCDVMAKKATAVIYEQLRGGTLGDEHVSICCYVPNSATEMGRRVVTLTSSAPLLVPTRRDIGRTITLREGGDVVVELAIVAQCKGLNKTKGAIETSTTTEASYLAEKHQSTDYTKFPASVNPYIPRQRLLYFITRGDNATLYFYNYSGEVAIRVKEVVERTILWHNSRARLLREIGLHKMGITHLSTLKSADYKNNPYLLLTWMDPETLVRYDYPEESLATPDFSKMPTLYAQMILKPYRFSDPAFTAKGISVCPFEDQTQQMLTLREDMRATLNDHRLFGEIHSHLQANVDEQVLNDEAFNRILARSRQVHFVQSPILLFPRWRRQIGLIRAAAGGRRGGVVDRNASQKRKDSAAIGASRRGGALGVRTQPNSSSVSAPKSALDAASAIGDEPCSLKIQYMLVEDYVAYLHLIGMQTLRVEGTEKSVGGSPPASSVARSSDFVKPSLEKYLPGITIFPPSVWLYSALTGGVLFVHLTAIEPYFCVTIYVWSRGRLACERLSSLSQPCQEAEDELRELEQRKNELLQKCHVHSFTYDFHLRMTSRYLVGGKEVLFNPGFDTDAYLTDFLMYYGCRPAHARNAICEGDKNHNIESTLLDGYVGNSETISFNQLHVAATNIWEHFLDSAMRFKRSVVRLKTQGVGGSDPFPNSPSASNDQFMLVTRQDRELFNQKYKYICVLLNSTRRMAVAKRNGNHMSLKCYTIFVNEGTTHPIIESGSSLTSKTNIVQSSEDESQQDSGSGLTGRCSAAGGEGEFTRIPPLSPSCSTLVDEEDAQATPSNDSTRDSSEQVRFDGDDAGCGALRMLASRSISLTHRYERPSALLLSAEAADESLEAGSLTRRRFCSGGNMAVYAPGGSRSIHAEAMITPSNTTTFSLRPEEEDGERRKEHPSTPANNTGGLENRRSSSTLPTTAAQGTVLHGIVIGSDRSKNAEKAVYTAFSGGLECSTAVSIKSLDHPSSFGGIRQLAIEKNPPRRHMSQAMFDVSGVESDETTLVPSEQVIYLHYMSSHQRRLQKILEEAVKANRDELSKFVMESDRLCYIDLLWKTMVSLKTTVRRPLPSLGVPSSSMRIADNWSIGGDPSSYWKATCTSELDAASFESLLRSVHVRSMREAEPRLATLLSNVDAGKLFQFLAQRYESEKRCRCFDLGTRMYMVIVDFRSPDCAAMLRSDLEAVRADIELFLIFKNVDVRTHDGSQEEGMQLSPTIRSRRSLANQQFQEVVNTLCAYLLSDICYHPPKRSST